jgi:hypothetical protein
MDKKQEENKMTGIAEADQTFYGGARHSVKQGINIAAPSKGVAIDLTSTDYTDSGKPFVVWCGGAGAVKVTDRNGNDITIAAIPAGARVGGGYGLVCVKVFKTGTSATSLVALS